MKKKHIAWDYFCDICGNKIEGQLKKCALCGKEICDYCTRYICSKTPPPSSSQSSSTWTFSFSLPPVPYFTEEMLICKACTDTLKLSLQVAARKRR